MDAAVATGAGLSFEVNGRQYILSPLTFGDLGKLEAWLISQRVRDALASLPGDSEADFRSELTRNIIKEGAGAEDVITAMAGSVRGLCEGIYLSLLHGQPQITREEVGELLTPQNVGTIKALWESQILEEEEEPAGDSGPKGIKDTSVSGA
jgi:hypothetical protein